MTDERDEDFAIRRILVALDPGGDCTACFAEISRLAARLQAEVAGLFVEDINILHSAALPFVRRFAGASGAWEEFGVSDVERELRSLAARAREALAAAAEHHRVRWTFQVVRGRVGVELTSASREADLIVVARRGPAAESTVRLVAGAPRSVLLLGALGATTLGVAAVYDGSPGAGRALAAAARLAEPGPLLVLVVGADRAALSKAAERRLEALGVKATLRTLGGSAIERVLATAAEAGGGILVMSADSPLLEAPDAERALERARLPVLLVRPAQAAA
ncbi:MAG TPA: hypothetical protein VMV26_19720 [Alphaproteobacteria bacterium]|jgi:hypothetical protein|nr:hypothetical protein [Alphaproteobacteria bacterium]